ncbi:MAG: CHAD domain-containing protein [Thermoflexales bacterium]|nr:CHAD domain-containing protein [Thermoflexales bacterium]
MEIEAKFRLTDVESLQRLQAAKSLAGLELASGWVKELHDTYLDTPKRSILAAGYACRRREQAGGVLMTLKGLGGAQGALHRREEIELELPPGAAPYRPGEWPASPLRDKLLELMGEAELVPLFDLRQSRAVRLLSLDGRTVAELCLDEVRVAAGEGVGERAHPRDQIYYELEVELSPQGTEEELAAAVRCLQDEWGLQPQPLSKFERGLAFVEGTSSGRLLSWTERAICKRLSTRDGRYGRRARALLALDEGLTQTVAGQRASLSARQVRYWLHAFRAKRLDVFPPPVLAEETEGRQIEKEIEEEEERGEGRGGLEAVEPPPEPVQMLTLPDSPGLETDDTMAEAARKTLYYHFQRMVYHEPGTRRGEDIEELHDMRVATRRMRAAFRVFDGYLDPETVQPFLKGLRRAGRTLGAVRDLDVMREKTDAYLATLPPSRLGELDPLLAAWQVEHDRARQAMLSYLDSRAYQQFKERFGAFLQTPGAGASLRNDVPISSPEGEPRPYRLRHVAPVALSQRLADVRAYDEWVSGPDVPLARLHQLRIACKRLRYTLEFFREVLGAETKMLVDELKAIQDHLGDLQDAVVASNLLRDFLTWGRWGPGEETAGSQPPATVIAPGVATYLAYRQTELQHLLETFPTAWARLHNAEFIQAMAHVADGL